MRGRLDHSPPCTASRTASNLGTRYFDASHLENLLTLRAPEASKDEKFLILKAPRSAQAGSGRGVSGVTVSSTAAGLRA